MYEAVRKLSILKEAKNSTQEQIDNAEAEVNRLQELKPPLSEMAQIRNLHWWTVEYGMIGTPEDPKLYGAGLLSSIGESAWCLSDNVKKLPYSIDAANTEFDITKPQPQLFVTPDFSYLMQVLDEFSNTMALRKGGWRGLQKLIDSKKIGTIELNTGLQISGVFTKIIKDEDNNVVFFKTEGPTALANREKELIGHGTDAHLHGFSSPIGKLKGINLAIEDMGPRDLKAYNFYDNKRIAFEYESGITIEGLNITGIRNLQGKLILIQFEDCTVKYNDEILFKPEYGTFDLAVGSSVVSAYAGSADFRSFENLYHVSESKTVKVNPNEKTKALEKLYQTVRDYRSLEYLEASQLKVIFEDVKENHIKDWLLSVELLELAVKYKFETLSKDIQNYLETQKVEQPKIAHLIDDGITLIS